MALLKSWLIRVMNYFGSDLNENVATKRLIALGAKVYQGHEAEHIKDADIVVTSSAVDNKNPEVVAAKRARIQ